MEDHPAEDDLGRLASICERLRASIAARGRADVVIGARKPTLQRIACCIAEIRRAPLLYVAQERLEFRGEWLGSFDTANVSHARQDDQVRGWDGGA